MVSHDGEDNIGLVSNVGKCDWCNHHNHEVEDPIGTINELVRTMPVTLGHISYLVANALVGARIRRGTISAG